METIHRRIERLEQENRRCRIAFSICILALVVLGVAGAINDEPKELNVKRLVIADGDGGESIELKADKTQAGIHLRDPSGVARISIVATKGLKADIVVRDGRGDIKGIFP